MEEEDEFERNYAIGIRKLYCSVFCSAMNKSTLRILHQYKRMFWGKTLEFETINPECFIGISNMYSFMLDPLFGYPFLNKIIFN